MHSMPIAEPVGVVVGVIAGRMGANLGKKLAAEWELPTFLGATVGAMISHYIASALTKAVINGAMIDPVGGGANLAVTSPATSLLHGAFEAISELFPGLDFDQFADFFGEEMIQTQPEIDQLLSGAPVDSFPVDASGAAELAHHSSNAVQHGQLGDIRFTGFEHVEHLADSQQGPTCVSEMAENIMQLDDPSLSNDASAWIQQITGTQGQRMDPGWIVPLLEQRGIPAGWFDFDHGQIASALQSNQAVGIVGHSHFLTSSFVRYDQYSPDLHCVTLTDVIKDGYGNITHYKGIDSNAQGQEVIWSAQAIEGAVRNAGAWANKALITLRPLRWPWTTS